MLLRTVSSLVFLLCLALPVRTNAMIDSGSGWHCQSGSTSGGGSSQTYLYCWYYDGGGGGGGGGSYNPDPDPYYYGGGGGVTGLPARPGYEVHNGVYVKEDGSVVDASHMYSCSTDPRILQDVVQSALEENGMIPHLGEVELVLSNGSWTWLRSGIFGADQFEPDPFSSCE